MAEQYPNRSDLRNPATRKVRFTGQTYGQGAAQERAQRAVAPGSAPSQIQAQRSAGGQAPMRPGERPLLRPTERPDEPVTAGANFGAGPNAAQAGIRPRLIPEDNVLETLRALYALYPNDDLAAMLSKYGNQGY